MFIQHIPFSVSGIYTVKWMTWSKETEWTEERIYEFRGCFRKRVVILGNLKYLVEKVRNGVIKRLWGGIG